MTFKDFLIKNKVFLLGFAAAIAVALQQFLGNAVVDYKVVGFAALMAALSYVANQWRGQGVTIFGILGTLAGTYVSIYSTGHFTWNQFILSAVAAVLSAVAPPPKPATYEKDANIVEAKQIPPVDQKIDDTKLPLGIKDNSTSTVKSTKFKKINR